MATAPLRSPNINYRVTDSWWHSQSPASQAREAQLREIAEREAVVASAALVIALVTKGA